MNILIVDDHPLSRRLLRTTLEAENMNVFDAADGIEALAVLAHDRIDAVITDILMPRMDGYRLCYEIRLSERSRQIPVLFYSATYTAMQDEARAREVGGDGFYRKPTPPAELIAALRERIARPRFHSVPGAPPAGIARTHIYSEQLVAQLEERNVELEETRVELGEAKALLEWRVHRRTEELSAANEHLDSFASFVAHEVRVPLRTIGGYARQLQDDYGPRLPDEARNLASAIVRGLDQTEHLTDALLQYCQVGARPVRSSHLDLNQIVHAALTNLAEEIQRRDVDVVVHPLPSCDGDPFLVELVFHHLLANALKFTRARTAPRIEVGVCDPAGAPVFFVRDNGVGFDMRHAHLVFEPFQQLHREAGFEGAGLGLSLVRNIVSRHDGSIWSESVVDEGTTFFFTLSRVEAPVVAGPIVAART